MGYSTCSAKSKIMAIDAHIKTKEVSQKKTHLTLERRKQKLEQK